MTIRSRRETVTFKRPFQIRGIDRLLPRGRLRGHHGRGDDRRAFVPLISPRCHHDHGARGAIARRDDGDGLDRLGRPFGCAADRREWIMTSEPTDLDKHRGMAARKAIGIRRALAEVETNARDLRQRQAIVESDLLAIPAASWLEAAAKARYVLKSLFGGTPAGRHPPSGSRGHRASGFCAAESRGLIG